MIYVAGSLVALGFCGLIFFAGRGLNLTRRVLNNLAPGEPYWGRGEIKSITPLGGEFRIQATAVDPALLTELGRVYYRQARQNDPMMIGWGAGGFIFIAGFFSYLKM
ncbi:hypothetical protein [Bradyrhizobium ivorense]|uniref:hypothetical protein n=1 Tax=Bradyrhizobium ivorense TaxID=2511166 RepID=UPI0010B4C11E|nr:hypothetical protein [Bradyrhizobium ivorense]VIO77364.1 hypothetical protein CI41S_56190 [Bradyrhizobium ivorense]